MLHRDVKPSNILITKDGSPVLGDFGLARMMATNERLTRLDTVVGTPEYMSPEQCAGTETGPASDQYALGVVAYEALTGHPPYHAETPAAVMLAQIQAPLPPPHTVNAELAGTVESALMRALAKEPADRFPDCTNFVETLTGARAPSPVIAIPRPMAAVVPSTASIPDKVVEAARPPTSRRWGRRHMAIGAAALVVLLVIGGLAYAAYNGSKRPGQSATTDPGLSHGSLIYDAKLSAAAGRKTTSPRRIRQVPARSDIADPRSTCESSRMAPTSAVSSTPPP